MKGFPYTLSVVNGAQTTGAIHAAGEDNAKNVWVLARIIVAADERMIPEIVAGNNTQNSILAWDRRSNDRVQIRIHEEFDNKQIAYVHRRDSTRKPLTSIYADQVGQMLCAFSGDLQTAIRAKKDIFESDTTYNRVFPPALAIGHIFAVQTLGWAYDRVKQELKQKSDEGNLKDIERKQLSLIEYPASKQFTICVAGHLREEITGMKLSEPQELEIKEEFINSGGEEAISAWVKVLKSILPLMAVKLPADEYQVVRSTEHTQTVANNTKGLVAAGADIIMGNFEELRKLLNPKEHGKGR